MGFKSENDVSMRNWMGVLLLSAIPGVNLAAWVFMLFSRNRSKRNFAKAALTWFLILAVLAVGAYVALCLFGKLDIINGWLGAHGIPDIPKLIGG
ncbi:MAG: hypothetical protein LBL66_00055 [Clostridiales bacterium]|jgi:nitric oxide reductase large subunit|nr:hypothetical protein [Clostridiales bacterium]